MELLAGYYFFFFNDTATTEIYTLSLHDALPISLLILAGAGSGKTRVLTHRIAYLIRDLDVAPRSILAVTFTNKAAREMKERLERLLGEGQLKDLTVGTFHAFCARPLRRDGPLGGVDRALPIYDEGDQRAPIPRAVTEQGVSQ